MSERRVIPALDFFAKTPQIEKVDVPIPELGDGVVIPVWQFTARQKSEWEMGNKSEGKGANLSSIRELFLVAICRNDDGSPYFAAGDVAKLGRWPIPIIERIFEAGKKLNSVTDADVEEMTKNSEATDADG